MKLIGVLSFFLVVLSAANGFHIVKKDSDVKNEGSHLRMKRSPKKGDTVIVNEYYNGERNPNYDDDGENWSNEPSRRPVLRPPPPPPFQEKEFSKEEEFQFRKKVKKVKSKPGPPPLPPFQEDYYEEYQPQRESGFSKEEEFQIRKNIKKVKSKPRPPPQRYQEDYYEEYQPQQESGFSKEEEINFRKKVTKVKPRPPQLEVEKVELPVPKLRIPKPEKEEKEIGFNIWKSKTIGKSKSQSYEEDDYYYDDDTPLTSNEQEVPYNSASISSAEY